MNATIKDIAKKIGISYSSVSRAINNKPGVSEETRAKVLKAAKEMGYQPNSLARGLVNKISNTIGVIVPDIVNPFFAEIIKGIMETSNLYGYHLFLCISGWDDKKEKEYIQTLQGKRVDGVIIKPSKDRKTDFYEKMSVPYILLESWPTNGQCSFVEVDNEKGGYLAAKHLLECGYKNPAFLGGKKDSYSNMQRLKGFKKALSEAGVNIENIDIVFGSFGMASGYEQARELLSKNKRADAIFAGNDVIALGVLQYAEEIGIKVPEELGVVGFDNIEYSRLPQIQLTTINQPKYELGRLVVETLIEKIRNKEKVIKKITLEPSLIIRKTTAPIAEV